MWKASALTYCFHPSFFFKQKEIITIKNSAFAVNNKQIVFTFVSNSLKVECTGEKRRLMSFLLVMTYQENLKVISLKRGIGTACFMFFKQDLALLCKGLWQRFWNCDWWIRSGLWRACRSFGNSCFQMLSFIKDDSRCIQYFSKLTFPCKQLLQLPLGCCHKWDCYGV